MFAKVPDGIGRIGIFFVVFSANHDWPEYGNIWGHASIIPESHALFGCSIIETKNIICADYMAHD